MGVLFGSNLSSIKNTKPFWLKPNKIACYLTTSILRLNAERYFVAITRRSVSREIFLFYFLTIGFSFSNFAETDFPGRLNVTLHE